MPAPTHTPSAGRRTPRPLLRSAPGVPTSDGAGVRLTRIIGTAQIDMIDPFLLLDAFESDDPEDYILGFPDHPHRGFETVTYLLAGRMRHKDSAGHEGVIEPGGVQWMTAGRGIVHSEMPEQEDGLLKGFQLWVNLPAAEKMTAPGYQEFSAEQIPVEHIEGGGLVRVIAGRTDRGTRALVEQIATEPLYLDISLQEAAAFEQTVPAAHAAFVYAIEGTVLVGEPRAPLPAGHLGVLGDGDCVGIHCGPQGGRCLLIAGRKLGEPIARAGPFVMNTREEVLQAFEDYRHGRL